MQKTSRIAAPAGRTFTQAPSDNDQGSQEDVYEGLKLDALMQKAGL